MHANTEHLDLHCSWELVVLRLVQAQFCKVSSSTDDLSEHCAWYLAGFVSLGIDLKLQGNCHYISYQRGSGVRFVDGQQACGWVVGFQVSGP